jgi:hypothetical protein
MADQKPTHDPTDLVEVGRVELWTGRVVRVLASEREGGHVDLQLTNERPGKPAGFIPLPGAHVDALIRLLEQFQQRRRARLRSHVNSNRK